MAGLAEKEVNFKNWKVPQLKKIPAGSRNICFQQKKNGRTSRTDGKSSRSWSRIDGRQVQGSRFIYFTLFI